jgi:hypothetical protein
MMFFLAFPNFPGAKDSGISGKPMVSTMILGSAGDLIGSVTAGSRTTSFGPVGAVDGAAPPAGTQTNKIASFDQTYKLDPAAPAAEGMDRGGQSDPGGERPDAGFHPATGLHLSPQCG